MPKPIPVNSRNNPANHAPLRGFARRIRDILAPNAPLLENGERHLGWFMHHLQTIHDTRANFELERAGEQGSREVRWMANLIRWSWMNGAQLHLHVNQAGEPAADCNYHGEPWPHYLAWSDGNHHYYIFTPDQRLITETRQTIIAETNDDRMRAAYRNRDRNALEQVLHDGQLSHRGLRRLVMDIYEQADVDSVHFVVHQRDAMIVIHAEQGLDRMAARHWGLTYIDRFRYDGVHGESVQCYQYKLEDYPRRYPD